jgi:hypothetical protein
MREAASVGGLFLFDLDFSVSAVGNLKTHHQQRPVPAARFATVVA